jgi:hypothetical protein
MEWFWGADIGTKLTIAAVLVALVLSFLRSRGGTKKQ